MSEFKILDDYFATKENVARHEVVTFYDEILERSSMRACVIFKSYPHERYICTEWLNGGIKECSDGLCNGVICALERAGL